MTAGGAGVGSGLEVAIVGMACRFPGARNPDRFWDNLRDGVESIRHFSEAELEAAGVPRSLLDDPAYVRAHGMLDGAELFDAAFFNVNPNEARIMDPQHRLLLECAWEALEDGGVDPRRQPGPVGVYAGAYYNTYLDNLKGVPGAVEPAAAFARSIANEKDYLVTRISYKLDLTGPSLTVQTACSTSLVAVHLACQGLLAGACDLALAGGVTVRARQRAGYLYQPGGIYSPDGHSRAFDAAAQGTVSGSGAGLVLLKRLEDALADRDPIRAVIRGSAIGNDGAAKVGYTAPSVDGQARVISAALAMAELEPAAITYVEAHGSATPLGDPIEVEALHRVFRTGRWRPGSCALGSVKTNIGHTHAAAGIAGLIKTVLAMQHRAIPPSLHFERPNPEIDFARSPFRVSTALTPWVADGPIRAGVSSFGMGGSNAHVVVEEAPAVPEERGGRRWHLAVLSARTETALEAATDALADRLRRAPEVDVADACYTLQVGRSAFEHRRVLVAGDRDDLVAALRARGPRVLSARPAAAGGRPLAFLLPGLGDQRVGMGRNLYRSEPVFRAAVDECAELLSPHLGVDLRTLLYPRRAGDEAANGEPAATAGRVDLRRMLGRDGRGAAPPSLLTETRHAQPATFVVELALARLWMAWGVRPETQIGYSLGEYVAAHLAGVMSLDDALFLVAHRARLIAGLPPGAMLAVPLPEERVRALLGSGVSLAAVNGRSQCVVAGPVEAVAGLEARLAADGVPSRRVQTSHAFHSDMMRPIADAFTELAAGVTLRPPRIPYPSNVTGDWITAAEATDPRYWARHLCAPVRFADGIAKLWREPQRVLLEVGPGQALGSLALQARPPGAGTELAVLASLPHWSDRQPEVRFLLGTAGRLWLAGVPLDWPALHAGHGRRRVALPTYPFEGTRHWVEPEAGRAAGRAARERPSLARKPDVADWFHMPAWLQLPPAGPAAEELARQPRRWLLLEDECGLSTRLFERLSEHGQQVTAVRAGDRLRRLGGRRWSADPGRPEDYQALLRELDAGAGHPLHIVHLWAVSRDVAGSGASRRFAEGQRRGFESLLLLARALARLPADRLVRCDVVTNGAHAVTGGEVLRPEQATLLGPCRVLPQEQPSVTCRNVDVALEGPAADVADRLLAELAGPAEHAVVAHRWRRRWRRSFEAVRVQAAGAPARLRQGGVYLITGGLGGIGLTLARHLAGAAGARLVLTGRSPLPPRRDWERHLAAPGEDDATRDRIRALLDLEAAGAEVLVQRADAADFAQMRRAVNSALREFGALNGIVHAAGVPGSGLMQRKTREMAATVMAAKVAGGLVVERLAAGLDLDFVVLCSSTLAITGAVGQSDYAAANAFLDALAHRVEARGGPFTVSVNWDAWREVGIASRSAGAAGGAPPASAARAVDHPLLDARLSATPTHAVYGAEFSADRRWLIDEHRMHGRPVIPGTGHLEMVRAAFQHHAGLAEGAGVELREVSFLTPIVVPDGETRSVRVVLERAEGEGEWRFAVASSRGPAAGTPRWQLHSSGRVSRLASCERRRLDVAGLIETAGLRDVGRPEHQGPMGYGARSRCLERIHARDGEALATIALPEEFAADLGALPLHPSLLDIAAGFMGVYLAREFRIPIAYERLQLKAPLTRRIYSHQRCREGGGEGRETVTSDIVIADERGSELVRIDGFVLKRAGALEARLSALGDQTAGEIVPYDLPEPARDPARAGGGIFRRHVETGILPEEGVQVFERILARGLGPQVVVATRDLDAMTADLAAAGMSRDGRGQAAGPERPAHPRPNVATAYAAPRDEVEKRLAAFWSELLGIRDVGIHDSFVELGGDSLLGLQLVPRLRAELGVALSPGDVFEALTVADQAALVRARSGARGSEATAGSPTS
jgi:acyl transferase domain-containing protein